MWTNTFMIEYGIFSEGGTRCPRKAPANFQAPAFMGNWEWRGFKGRGARVRESAAKAVGNPDAGNRDVRIDERGWETGRRLYVSTRAHPRRYPLAGRLASPLGSSPNQSD